MFWGKYPRDGRGRIRGDRKRTFSAYRRVAGQNPKKQQDILDGLMRARRSAACLQSMLKPQPGDHGGKYIPHAERFLSGEQFLRDWPPYHSVADARTVKHSDEDPMKTWT